MVIFKKVNITKASDYDPLIVWELEKYGQDVIVGVFSSHTHSWIACGPQLFVVNHADGSLRSSWTFGEENNEHTDITCATELPMEGCSIPLLILGVCSETSSHISFFNPNTRNILRTININYPVRALCVVEDGVSTVNPINSSLSQADGLLAVGAADGTLLLIDLCRSLLITGVNEGYGCKAVGAGGELELMCGNELTEAEVGSRLAACRSRGHSLAIPLSDGDLEGVTALFYCYQSASLCVGTSSGVIHIWNLSSLTRLWRLAGSGPVISLCLLEPVDDPRHNLYLWACHEGAPPVAFMHCLLYSSKFNVPEYGAYYQGFEAANLVYTLRPGSESGRTEEARRILGCQSLARTVPRSLIRATGGVPEAESSQMRVVGLSYESWGGGARLVVFDLNQWYREQMPEEAGPPSDCLETLELPGPGLAVSVLPSSLTHYQWVKPLEQHFQPASFNFVMWLLEEKGVLCLEKAGLQSVWLRNMAACGGGCLLDPGPVFKGCLAAGLVPAFFDPPHPDTASKEEERSYVLTVCLENRLLSVLESAAEAWAPGVHSVSGCTLDHLLSWLWQLHTLYKSHAHKICTPLFDHSGLDFDVSEKRRLQHCKSLLNAVEAVYRRVVRKNSPFIINKDCEMKLSAMSLIRFYVECSLKFVSLSILPEPNESGRPRNSLAYKYDQIRAAISNRRGRCGLLCDTLVEPVSVLDSWSHEGGAPQYPPPSVQSLLRLCLHPGLDIQLKLSLMMYFYLDLLHINEVFMDQKVANFQHLLGMSDIQQQIVVGFWKLDHSLVEEGARLMMERRVETALLTETQHRTVLRILASEGHHKLALQYLRIKAPPLHQPSDLQLEMDLLLRSQLTQEAFLFQRRHPQLRDGLLQQFFKGASELNQLTPVFGFNMESVEEAAFMNFLKSSNLAKGGDLQVLFLLSKARYNEAVSLNDKLNRSGHVSEPKRCQDREVQTRDLIVRRVTSSVCPLGRDLEREIRNYKPPPNPGRDMLRPLSVSLKIRTEKDGPLMEADPRRVLSAVAREARRLQELIKARHSNGLLQPGKKRLFDWEEMEMDLRREPSCKKARRQEAEVTPPKRKSEEGALERQVMELVGTPLVRRQGATPARHLTATHSILKWRTPDKAVLEEDLTDTPKKTLRFALPDNQGRVGGRKSLEERSRTGCLLEGAAPRATPPLAGDVTPTTGHQDSLRERLRSSTKKKLISEEEGNVDWSGLAETVQPRVLFCVGSSTPSKKRAARSGVSTPLSRNIPADVSLSSSEREELDESNRDSAPSPITETIFQTTLFKASSRKEPDPEESIANRYKRQKLGVDMAMKEEDLISLEVKETSARNVYVIKALQNSVKEMRRKMEETSVLGDRGKEKEEEESEVSKNKDTGEGAPERQIEKESQLQDKDRSLLSEEEVTEDEHQESDLESGGEQDQEVVQKESEDDNVGVEPGEDVCRKLPTENDTSQTSKTGVNIEEYRGVCVMISSSDEEVDVEESRTQKGTSSEIVEDCPTLELGSDNDEEEAILEEKSLGKSAEGEGNNSYLIKEKKSEENVTSNVSGEVSGASLVNVKNCVIGQSLRDMAAPADREEGNYDFLDYPEEELQETVRKLEDAEDSNSESCLYENLVNDFQGSVGANFQQESDSDVEISVVKNTTEKSKFFGESESEKSNGGVPEEEGVVYNYAEEEQTEIFPRVTSGRRRRNEDFCECSSDSEEDQLEGYDRDSGSSESNGGSHLGYLKQGRERDEEIICLDSETEESSEEGVMTEIDGDEEETELMTENEEEEPEEMSGNDEEFEQTTEEDENEEEEDDAGSEDEDLVGIVCSPAGSAREAAESTGHSEESQKKESEEQRVEDTEAKHDTSRTMDDDSDYIQVIAEEDVHENNAELDNRTEEIEEANEEQEQQEDLVEDLKENEGKPSMTQATEDLSPDFIEESVHENVITIDEVMSIDDFEEDIEYENEGDTEEAISVISEREEKETTVPDKENNRRFGLGAIEEGMAKDAGEVTSQGVSEDTMSVDEESSVTVVGVRNNLQSSSQGDVEEKSKQVTTLGLDKWCQEVAEEKPPGELLVSDVNEIGEVEEKVQERRNEQDEIQEEVEDVLEMNNVTIEVQFEAPSELQEEARVSMCDIGVNREENEVCEIEELKSPDQCLIEEKELWKGHEQGNDEVVMQEIGSEMKQDSDIFEEKTQVATEKQAVEDEALHKMQSYLIGNIKERPEEGLAQVEKFGGENGSEDVPVAGVTQVTDLLEENKEELTEIVILEVSSGKTDEVGALVEDKTPSEEEHVAVLIQQPDKDMNEETGEDKIEGIERLETEEVVPRNVEEKSPKEENLQDEIVEDGKRNDDLKKQVQTSQVVTHVVDNIIQAEDMTPKTIPFLKIENEFIDDETAEQKGNGVVTKDVREKNEEICLEKTFVRDEVHVNAKSFFFGHQDNGSYLRTSLATFSVGSRLSLPEEDESVDPMEVAMIQDSEEGSNEVQEDTGNTIINLSPPHLSPEDDESKNVNKAPVIFSKEKDEEEEEEVRNRIMPSLSPQRSPVEDRVGEVEICTEVVRRDSPVKAVVEDDEEDDPGNVAMLDLSPALTPEDHRTQDKSILTVGSYLQRKALKKQLKKASSDTDRIQSSSSDRRSRSSVRSSSQTTVQGSNADEALLGETRDSKTSLGPELVLKSILKKETRLTAERQRSVDKETDELSDRRRSSRSRRGSSVAKEPVPETRSSSQEPDLKGILKNKEPEELSVKTKRSRRNSQEPESGRETKDDKTRKSSSVSQASDNSHRLRSLQEETSRREYKRPRASSLEPKGILKNKDRKSSATLHMLEDPSDVNIVLEDETFSVRDFRCSSEELGVAKNKEAFRNSLQEVIASRKLTSSLHVDVKRKEHDVRSSSRRRSSVSSQSSDNPQDLSIRLEEVLKDKVSRRSKRRSSISSHNSEDFNDVKTCSEDKRSSRTSTEQPLKGILKNTTQEKNRRSTRNSPCSQTWEDPREEEEDKQDMCSVKSGRSSDEPQLKGILKQRKRSSVSSIEKKRLSEAGFRESNEPKESGRSSRNSCKNISLEEEERNAGSSRHCDAAKNLRKEGVSDRRLVRSLEGQERRRRKSSCSSDTAKDLRVGSEEDFFENKKYKRCRSYSMGSQISEHATDLRTCRLEEDLSENRKRSVGQPGEADEYIRKKKLKKSYSGEFLRSVDYPEENQRPRRSSKLPCESRKSRRNSISSHSSDYATDLRLRIEEEDLASLASGDREENNRRLREVSSEEKPRRSNRERRCGRGAAGREDLCGLEDGAPVAKRSRSLQDYPVKRGSRLPRPTLGAILEEEDVASPGLPRPSSVQELRTAQWLRSQPTTPVIPSSHNDEPWLTTEISAEAYTQERRLTRTQKKMVLGQEQLQGSPGTSSAPTPRRSGRSKVGAGDSSVSSEGSGSTPMRSSKRLVEAGVGATPRTLEETSSGDAQPPASTPTRRQRRLSETPSGDAQPPASTPTRRQRRLSETPSTTPTRASRRLQNKPPQQHTHS